MFCFSLQILEKVYVQFQSFLEDPQYKDQHELQTTMIRTFGKVAPHAEPHFRDEGTSAIQAVHRPYVNIIKHTCKTPQIRVKVHGKLFFFFVYCFFFLNSLIAISLLYRGSKGSFGKGGVR